MPFTMRRKHSGNVLGKHTDGKDQGDLVVSLELEEKALFQMFQNSTGGHLEDIVMKPGTAVYLHCTHDGEDDDLLPCENIDICGNTRRHSRCPRHHMGHGVLCAHHPDCEGCQKPGADRCHATATLGARSGTRRVAIFRFYHKNRIDHDAYKSRGEDASFLDKRDF